MLALALTASSCGKKSGSEPVNPNPSVTPTPGGNNGGSNGQSGNTDKTSASVTLTAHAGMTLTVNGKAYTANSNNEIYLNGDYKKLEISGANVPMLAISGANLEEVNIKEAMPQLKEFGVSNNGKDTQKKIKYNLSGLTAVTKLQLGDYNYGSLDLSAMTALKELYLGVQKDQAGVAFDKVILPANNQIEVLKIYRAHNVNDATIDLSLLKKVMHVDIRTTTIRNFSFPNSTELEEIYLNSPSGAGSVSLVLKNSPKLKSVRAWNISFDNMTINNAPKFNGLSLSKNGPLNLEVKTLDVTGLTKPAIERTLKAIDKTKVEKLVAPGHGFVLGTAPLDGFTKLNSSNTSL